MEKKIIDTRTFAFCTLANILATYIFGYFHLGLTATFICSLSWCLLALAWLRSTSQGKQPSNSVDLNAVGCELCNAVISIIIKHRFHDVEKSFISVMREGIPVSDAWLTCSVEKLALSDVTIRVTKFANFSNMLILSFSANIDSIIVIRASSAALSCEFGIEVITVDGILRIFEQDSSYRLSFESTPEIDFKFAKNKKWFELFGLDGIITKTIARRLFQNYIYPNSCMFDQMF